MPHAPQFRLSVWVSRQRPLQSVWLPGHRHVPAWHVVPGPHALPHAPQFELSLLVLTQTRPDDDMQAVVPPVHEHVPFEQTSEGPMQV